MALGAPEYVTNKGMRAFFVLWGRPAPDPRRQPIGHGMSGIIPSAAYSFLTRIAASFTVMVSWADQFRRSGIG